MWKAITLYLMGIALLFTLSLSIGRQAFPPEDLHLALADQAPPAAAPRPLARTMDDTDYHRIRLAFNAFDLMGGLTKRDLENIPGDGTYHFAFLLACFWLIVFLRKPRKPLNL